MHASPAAGTANRLPFQLLEPSFFAGLFDDPLLWVGVRPTGRALLVDCGRMQHLAKRALRSLDTVLVSHAHMDHLMGFPTLLRHVHVAPRRLQLFGPPGFANRIGHLLAGFDWNLAEPGWCTFAVDEIHEDHFERWEFAGSGGFRGHPCGRGRRDDLIVWSDGLVRVEAALGDHRIPVLMFRLTEREGFAVDRQALQALGLRPGPWLGQLKTASLAGRLAATTLHPPASSDSPTGMDGLNAATLYQAIQLRRPAASIGYLTDMELHEENLQKASKLLAGVTLLVAECAFLAADASKARKSGHLCTTDLNRLVDAVRPAYLLPMHLSKNYLRRGEAPYQELELPTETRLLRLPAYRSARPLRPDECRLRSD